MFAALVQVMTTQNRPAVLLRTKDVMAWLHVFAQDLGTVETIRRFPATDETWSTDVGLAAGSRRGLVGQSTG